MSERSAREKLNDMKVHYKKKKHQIICLDELCTYFDIKNPEDKESIRAEMNSNRQWQFQIQFILILIAIAHYKKLSIALF